MISKIASPPEKTVYITVGFSDGMNFMNVYDPAKPTRLKLDLTERCIIEFTLSDQFLEAGWHFQSVPITFQNDWGFNFSSFYWQDNEYQGEVLPYSKFRVIYENERMGVFIYSLFMRDRLGQPIDLDPKIENGVGD